MLETNTRMIKIKIDLHQERISRKKIARYACAKLIPIQPAVKYPDQIPKIRMYEQLKPIKYTLLDGIGLAPKIYFSKEDFSKQPIKSATLRPSKLSNLSSNLPKISDNTNTSTSQNIASSSFGTIRFANSKGRNSMPPMEYGSLFRNPKDQRMSNTQLLMVAPPQVPSNYSISSVDNEHLSNSDKRKKILDGKKCRFKTNPAIINESIPENYIDKGKF